MPKLTHAQRRYVRRKLRDARASSATTAPADDELNIVPFLDIVVNLVMFLLMVTTASLAAGQLPIVSPARAAPETGTPRPSQLTVGITREATYLVYNRNQLAPECASLPSVGGVPDALALRRCTEVMHRRDPDARIVLAPDLDIRHEYVIDAMDALRGTAMRPLYTSIRLAAGVR